MSCFAILSVSKIKNKTKNAKALMDLSKLTTKFQRSEYVEKCCGQLHKCVVGGVDT